jgi:hypothetical protein
MRTSTIPRHPRFRLPELPDILRSYEDLERFHHRGLSALTDEELLAEEIRTKAGFAHYSGTRVRVPVPGGANTVLASEWLLEHLKAIRAEAKRRRGTR